MDTKIHPTAVIDAGAEIGSGVEVGPYCVVGDGVRLGDGCWLQGHVTICGPSVIGARNRFFAYGSIGQQTQDLKYEGEPTYLTVGEGNTFREFVTVNRGTSPGARTVIGSRGNFLAYSHIAHDCVVGDDVIFSNNGTVAGHVTVGNHVVLGGFTAVHQFCRIGDFAITGGCSKVVKDVPPFFLADGNPAQIRGINAVGLERNGFSADDIRGIKEAYRILYRGKLTQREALDQLDLAYGKGSVVGRLADFVRESVRGITG
jgi:UDP-N-acetylglucosamine acyltransferase